MELKDIYPGDGTAVVNYEKGVVTLKGEKETLEYAIGAVIQDGKGIDQVPVAPTFSYKTDKGKITRSAITEADLEPLE